MEREHVLSADCWCNPEIESFTERHPLSQAFHDKLDVIGELHDRKQADYGRDSDPFYNVKKTEEWGIPAWVGALIRLDDKVGRLRNLSQNGEALRNESVEDSLMDIAVYALISLVLYEEATVVEPEASQAAHVTSLQAA